MVYTQNKPHVCYLVMTKPVRVPRQADLRRLPEVIKNDATHITLGDLHGNALKLIYVLIEEGVMELKYAEDVNLSADALKGQMKKRYDQLRAVYSKPVHKLTKDEIIEFKKNITEFKKIINKAQINTNKAITLIGDELADRGNNDYLTLLMLQRLRLAGVNIDILLSNHSSNFIRDFEKFSKFTGKNEFEDPSQGQSLINMEKLIQAGVIEESEVRTLVNDHYQVHNEDKPVVKAINYTMSRDGEITLLSHAPIGLETIHALAKKFGVPYVDNTPKGLISTIDLVNAKIHAAFINNKLASLIDAEVRNGHPDRKKPIPLNYPLHRLIWGRVLGDELITVPSGGFKVNFVHGHIGQGPTLKNGLPLLTHQNTDTYFGKGDIEIADGDDVQHLTLHSSNLTKKELTHELLTEISSDCMLRIAKEKIQLAQDKLKTFLDQLKDLYQKVPLNELNEYIVSKEKEVQNCQDLAQLATLGKELLQSVQNFEKQVMEIHELNATIDTCNRYLDVVAKDKLVDTRTIELCRKEINAAKEPRELLSTKNFLYQKIMHQRDEIHEQLEQAKSLCHSMLSRFESFKLGDNDLGMRIFMNTKRSEIGDIQALEQASKLYLELQSLQQKLAKDFTTKAAWDLAQNFRARAKNEKITINMAAKAEKIEKALCNIPVEERYDIDDESRGNEKIKSALGAIASHRHPWRSKPATNAQGEIDKESAAKSFRDYKANMQEIRERSQSATLTDIPSVKSATP